MAEVVKNNNKIHHKVSPLTHTYYFFTFSFTQQCNYSNIDIYSTITSQYILLIFLLFNYFFFTFLKMSKMWDLFLPSGKTCHKLPLFHFWSTLLFSPSINTHACIKLLNLLHSSHSKQCQIRGYKQIYIHLLIYYIRR